MVPEPKRIDKLTAENKDLEQQIQTLNEQLANPDKEKLSLEQFLNLSKQIAIRVKRGDVVKGLYFRLSAYLFF